MADFADRASELQEQATEEALQRVKDCKPLRRTGRCHNCSEQVEPWETFCDEDCRDDYDKRQDAEQRRTGGGNVAR